MSAQVRGQAQRHTPGPWTLDTERTDDGTYFIQNSFGREGFAVAEVYGLQGDPESHANARLIAAAPEMLAALRTALALMDGATPDPNDGGAWMEAGDYASALLACVAA